MRNGTGSALHPYPLDPALYTALVNVRSSKLGDNPLARFIGDLNQYSLSCKRGMKEAASQFSTRCQKLPPKDQNPVPDNVVYPTHCGKLCQGNNNLATLNMQRKLKAVFEWLAKSGKAGKAKNIGAAFLFVAVESYNRKDGQAEGKCLQFFHMADAIDAFGEILPDQHFICYHLLEQGNADGHFLDGCVIQASREEWIAPYTHSTVGGEQTSSLFPKGALVTSAIESFWRIFQNHPLQSHPTILSSHESCDLQARSLGCTFDCTGPFRHIKVGPLKLMSVDQLTADISKSYGHVNIHELHTMRKWNNGALDCRAILEVLSRTCAGAQSSSICQVTLWSMCKAR